MEMAHLTSNKRRSPCRLLVLRLLLTHFPHTLHSQPISFNGLTSLDGLDLLQLYWWCWWSYCVRWFLRLVSLAISTQLPLRVRDQAQDAPREKFSLSEVCAHNLVRREWRKMSHLDSMGLTVPTLPIICPFRLYRGYGFPFLASNWVTSCHLPLGFPFLATNCVFHCHASIGCLLGLLYLLTICCGISLFHRAFYHFAVVCCCDLHSTNLSDKNGSRNLPFSASNFDSQCRLLRHPWCLRNLHGSSQFHRAFYHHLTIAGCDLKLANLIAKNGSWNLPFSASNCDIRCYIWLYFCLASGLSPLDRGFYHICNHVSMDCGGSIPPSEFWSWSSSTLTLDGLYCPLRSSNGMLECILFVLTCHVVDLPSELLYLFTRKLSAISCMACSWLVFLTCILSIDTCLCATCVREFDDSTHESPLHLLTICMHSTFSLDACTCHLFDICCVLTFATCMDAHCALGLDDSIHKSPLPIACTSFTLAFAIGLTLLLSDLSVTESSTDSTLNWLFSSLALLAATLWYDTLATVKGRLILYYLVPCFAYIVYALHLPPHMYGMESSPLPTPMTGDLEGKSSRDSTLPMWLVWVLTWLTLRLWHFALAIFHDIIVKLICIVCKNSLASMSCLLATCREQIGMMARCRQFTSLFSLDLTNSRHDSDGSIDATCTSPRLDSTHLSSGWDLRSPPLPSSVTIMTTQFAEEDALTWASNINSEESLPLSFTNSPHCSDDFAAACTFFTTFTPSFHHTECPDEDGILPPILDTGATHCLLPLSWLTNEQSLHSKKIHLQVASGSKTRALLYNNIIYCATVSRPLISVGQMKSMLDLRFVWNDSSPLLLACSGGLSYVLMEATIFHNLPVITSHEMMALLEAVHTFTATGALWNAATWSEKLGRKLSLFHWSAPSHPVYLPHDDAAFTDDPQVMFSSMDTLDLLEAAIGDTSPLLASSSQVVPLQPSSSSSDALPSSSVITFNIADHDPPTEDEQPKKERRVTKKERRVTFDLTDHDSPFDDEQPKDGRGSCTSEWEYSITRLPRNNGREG